MKNILIRKIEEEDIAKTAIVFAKAFNFMDQKEDWTKDTAIKYINYWLKRKSDMFFIAVKNGNIVGGMVGDIKPFKDKVTLTEIVLFVSPEFHTQGIAKKLVRNIIDEAVKKYNISTVCGIANSEVEFPMGWYNRIGLKKTKWVFIEGEAKEILKKLEA